MPRCRDSTGRYFRVAAPAGSGAPSGRGAAPWLRPLPPALLQDTSHADLRHGAESTHPGTKTSALRLSSRTYVRELLNLPPWRAFDVPARGGWSRARRRSARKVIRSAGPTVRWSGRSNVRRARTEAWGRTGPTPAGRARRPCTTHRRDRTARSLHSMAEPSRCRNPRRTLDLALPADSGGVGSTAAGETSRRAPGPSSDLRADGRHVLPTSSRTFTTVSALFGCGTPAPQARMKPLRRKDLGGYAPRQ